MADLDKQFKDHEHNGLDNKKIDLKNITGDFSDIITPSSNISDPTGGAVIDSEARTSIDAILDLLQEQGLME